MAFLAVAVAMMGMVRQRNLVAARYSGPRRATLVLRETVRDFGTVTAGQGLKAVFTVLNTGTGRLVINEEGCGACGSSKQTALINAGGQENITVELQTAGLRGKIIHARQFHTSDSNHPQLTLTVTADVVP